LYCLELICEHERCDWSELIYVGDNPTKDFVALNRAVRALAGRHRDENAQPGFEACEHIADLDGQIADGRI
jgi:putative hydrolase of the HAD superfamily